MIGSAVAALIAAAGLVGGAQAGADAFKAAEQRIETQAKAQRKACDRFKDNARDVCQAQAKGWEKVAKAKLEAQRKPGPETEKLAKFAQADADFAVAKQRCESSKGKAHDTCVDQAKAAREAAIRLAKVEKVEEQNAQLRAKEEKRTAAAKAMGAGAAPKPKSASAAAPAPKS